MNKSLLPYSTAFMLLSATLFGKGISTTIAPEYMAILAVPDVYVAGDFGLIKNGVLQDGYGPASSVFVIGNDVYVAGYRHSAEKTQIATVWKNGVAHSLGDGINPSGAKAVFVWGDDVYVAGWEKNSRGQDAARFWKNGVAQNIPNGYTANSVFVSDGEVYVAGSFGLYKNGTLQGGHGWLTSVFVSGGVAYATGYDDWRASLWRNGTGRAIGGTHTCAESVFVMGEDVYTAGWNQATSDQVRPRAAVMWKNGRAQVLSDTRYESRANSVFVSGDDVYVAGRENNAEGLPIAILWKNGVKQILGNGEANAVFVK
ncbi:MAG: hypothetical protein FWG12_06900 [Holophagaceae bacterium]|nr:hypothetical protein [Holophagaceae bacterium]